MNFNQEEQEILTSYNNYEWYSVATSERIAELKSYAEATSNQKKTVILQLSSFDLEAIQAQAKEKGISDQTLISNILHEYVMGRLVDS
ncbi:MAG: antitoxin [Crocosphaera sp.]|nr:antitoxin [Crocosphaera sp.]